MTNALARQAWLLLAATAAIVLVLIASRHAAAQTNPAFFDPCGGATFESTTPGAAGDINGSFGIGVGPDCVFRTPDDDRSARDFPQPQDLVKIVRHVLAEYVYSNAQLELVASDGFGRSDLDALVENEALVLDESAPAGLQFFDVHLHADFLERDLFVAVHHLEGSAACVDLQHFVRASLDLTRKIGKPPRSAM